MRPETYPLPPVAKRARDYRAADFGRVAVLCGGWSAEREVSLQSGANVLAALQARGVNAELVDVQRNRLLRGQLDGFDRAVNVVHGRGGEDGVLQAVLEVQGLPCAGSGVAASALAMDKLRSKQVWRACGLPTMDFALLRSPAEAEQAAATLGYPLFVKPVADGSSVGISKVRRPDQLQAAVAEAARHGAVLLEAFASGRELTCAVLDGTALPLVVIEPEGEFYDYHAKYLSDATRYRCPAPLEAPLTSEIQSLALAAFSAVGAQDYGRVDFMLDGAGRPQILEINTLPGMTSHSLVPMAAAAAGIDFAGLCWLLLVLSMEESR